MRKTLKGGTFNLEHGRDPDTVKLEVVNLLEKHHLDFLCVQEASDYKHILENVSGYVYVVGVTAGGKDNGILVKRRIKQDRVYFYTFGNGWTTVRGGHHPETSQNQVRLDGWLYIRCIHLPTPSDWRTGKPVGPANRLDDLISAVKGLRNYFRWPCIRNARIAAGDWNEPPETDGEYSPQWIARKSKANTVAPTSKAGHGRIDWVMYKGCSIRNIVKDTDIKEASDHEPVVFTVVKM